ncbi:MAG: T9SS type A sorting domain-containing protein [Fulvivirga sp.]
MKSFVTLLIALGSFALSSSSQAQTTYTWDGSINNDYTMPGNWTPVRLLSGVMPNDKLVFNNGGTVQITNVPTQSIGSLTVSNNTEVELNATSVNKILTITGVSGIDMLVEESSSLTFKNNGGVRIDVEVDNSATVEVGGSITMERGTFDVNNATLILHTNTNPLSVGTGAFSLGSGCTLELGKAGTSSASAITLPDNVFVSSPSIGNLTMNNANGAVLGNQSLTVTNAANFVNGDLATNNLGRLIFSTSATSPIETSSSKILGYAEMTQRSIGFTSISFFGYSISAGIDDIGNVSIVRKTGEAGVNFYDDNESIAVTWDVNVQTQPENGRNVTMQWFADFDNNNDINVPMQMYRYANGTNWEVVGGATDIASNVNNLRTSASVLTTEFSEWTISSANNALPVSLVSFTGESSANEIVLTWKTASELNNDKFFVEKNIDGEFVALGSVKGNGTTSEVNTYEFIDYNAKHGNNYYRLVQQDLDGTQTIHETIAVDHVVNTEFEVYPNPSAGKQLLVNLDGEPGEDAKVRLFDAHGTLIIEQLVAGSLRVDVLEGRELSKGLYYLELTHSGASKKRRVVVN